MIWRGLRVRCEAGRDVLQVEGLSAGPEFYQLGLRDRHQERGSV